jgi:REP element-mobilizing transposase RayT
MKYDHLMHLDIAGYYQFITFRTHDSSDDFLKRLYHQEKPANKKQLEIDNYLDNSEQGAYLNGRALLFLNHYLKKTDSQLYELLAFAIMPNHVHLLIKPLIKLSSMMQRIKGESAYELNKLLVKSGTFWEADYYDKAIRNQTHFDIVYNYIKNNPLKLIGDSSRARFYGVYEN